MDKFIVDPSTLPSDADRELLIILSEECSEIIRECVDVQQRVSKALRFGLDEIQSGQLLDNKTRLAIEIGELFEVVDRLGNKNTIEWKMVTEGKIRKRNQLNMYLQYTDE